MYFPKINLAEAFKEGVALQIAYPPALIAATIEYQVLYHNRLEDHPKTVRFLDWLAAYIQMFVATQFLANLFKISPYPLYFIPLALRVIIHLTSLGSLPQLLAQDMEHLLRLVAKIVNLVVARAATQQGSTKGTMGYLSRIGVIALAFHAGLDLYFTGSYYFERQRGSDFLEHKKKKTPPLPNLLGI
jgi:hypothetical protein